MYRKTLSNTRARDLYIIAMMVVILLLARIAWYILIPLFQITYIWFSDWQMKQAVKAELTANFNVQVIDLFSELNEYVYATVLVKGHGIIHFAFMYPDPYEQNHHVFISRIGSMCIGGWDAQDELIPIKTKYVLYRSVIDIGSAGPLAKAFPFNIQSEQDAIEHYEDILAVIEKWPKNLPMVTPNTTYEMPAEPAPGYYVSQIDCK
jgi:hypothetical protein